MNILLILIFVVSVIYVISTRYSKKFRNLEMIPGPKAYPIFGNILMFNTNCRHELWEIIRTITRTFYPITKIWFFSKAVVSVRHPDDLEVVLSSQKVISKGYIYEDLQPWLKTGLLTSTGEKWRRRRKILTPAFHFGILKKYLDITNVEGEKFVNTLKTGKSETIASLVPFCSKYTLNIICESAMGINLDSLDSETSDNYKQAVHDFGNIIIYRSIRPYVQRWMLPFIYKIGKLNRESLRTLHEFTTKVINSRKEYHMRTANKYLTELSNQEQLKISEKDDGGPKKKLVMLDLLLAAQQNGLIDDEGIQEEVDTFTFEGHDTTGMAMTYLLLLLAENQEAQDRARAEVVELLSRNNGKLEMADLQELNYLERCIKESLRLFPPVATIMRYTTEDLQLANGLAPAGSNIIIQIFDAHRDPNFWTEPEKFDPDRFLPEHTKTRHPFAYVPFSAGPRNCIGQKFAVMELKSLTARLLYNFRLEPIDRVSDVKLTIDIVIRPINPIHVKFISIHRP